MDTFGPAADDVQGLSVAAAVSSTLTAKAGYRLSDGDLDQLVSLVGPEVAVRRLTPREHERLQGFPDDWTATSNGRPQADSPRYQQLGNSIAVHVFEWVFRRLVAVDAASAGAVAA